MSGIRRSACARKNSENRRQNVRFCTAHRKERRKQVELDGVVMLCFDRTSEPFHWWIQLGKEAVVVVVVGDGGLLVVVVMLLVFFVRFRTTVEHDT